MDIYLKDSLLVRIVNITIGIECLKCGKTWGKRLDDKFQTLPEDWDVCLHCANKILIDERRLKSNGNKKYTKGESNEQ